VRGWRKI